MDIDDDVDIDDRYRYRHSYRLPRAYSIPGILQGLQMQHPNTQQTFVDTKDTLSLAFPTCEILGINEKGNVVDLIMMCLCSKLTSGQLYWMVLWVNLTQVQIIRDEETLVEKCFQGLERFLSH